MADIYTKMSDIVDLGEEANDFLIKAAAYLHLKYDLQDEEAFTAEDFPREVSEFCDTFMRSIETPYSDEIVDLGVKFERDQKGVWIHSEEVVELEYVSQLIKDVMEKFDVDRPVAFQWSDGSSKPLVGAFGGGACVITKDEIRTQASTGFIHDTLKEIRGEKRVKMTLDRFLTLQESERRALIQEVQVEITDVDRKALEDAWFERADFLNPEDILSILKEGFTGMRERSDAELVCDILAEDPDFNFGQGPRPGA